VLPFVSVLIQKITHSLLTLVCLSNYDFNLLIYIQMLSKFSVLCSILILLSPVQTFCAESNLTFDFNNCSSFSLETEPPKTNSIDALIDYVKNNRPSCEDSLGHIANKIICSSSVLDYDYGMAKGFEFLGFHYYFRATLDSALLAFNLARDFSENKGFLDIMARTSNGLGLTYSNLSFHDIALLYQQEYLEYADRLDNKTYQAEAFHNTATLHYYLENFDEQKRFLAKASELLSFKDYTPENKGWHLRAEGKIKYLNKDYEGALAL